MRHEVLPGEVRKQVSELRVAEEAENRVLCFAMMAGGGITDVFTREAIVGLWTGEPATFLSQYGQMWKSLSDRVSVSWRQPDMGSKLGALAAAMAVALLFLGSLFVLAWFLVPLLIFGAFVKAIFISMGRLPRKGR